jgi:myxalamid-type polyketide synthase MxaE and MxaD
VARHLVKSGARRLILMGRTPLPARTGWASLDPTSQAGQRVALVRSLEQMGAAVHVATLDVSNAAALRTWLEAYGAEGWPPIRGVLHLAALFDGHLLQELEPETLAALMRPKIAGAWLLSELLGDLDFFVVFSSLAALLPQPGQGAYAAANGWLDALAHQRQADGRPALSVNWGVWSSGNGEVAEEYRQRTEMADRLLAARGFGAFRMEDGLEALDLLLHSALPQATFAPVDPARLAESHAAHPAALLDELATAALESSQSVDSSAQPHSLRTQIEAADDSARLQLLEAHVRQTAARVLKMQPERLSPAKPFGAMGLDSLMGVELRNRLELDLGLRLPATLAWNYPTVDALSTFLLGKIALADGPPTAGLNVPAAETTAANAQDDGAQLAALVADLQTLSDDDALRALLEGAKS